MSDYHVPVLLNEAISYLNIRNGEKYIDCTLGGGGHTSAILKAGGVVMSFDQDQEAIENAKSGLLTTDYGKNLTLKKSNFSQIGSVAKECGFGQVSGVLFDLGVSSHQLDTDYRGFSFNKDAKLDMRMDQDLTVTAADLVNAGSEEELAKLFWNYGEERYAKRIARVIVEERKRLQSESGVGIETTNQLAELITKIRPKTRGDRMHPATRVFQALRVAVNSELENLSLALNQAFDLLKPGGRLVVISFHSLEDRIVKDFMKEKESQLKVLTNKPVMATEKEIDENPRSRSGKLRAGERL